MLMMLYLKMAFVNTSKRRGSSALIDNMDLILDEVAISPEIQISWKNYQRKFDYAAEIDWGNIMHTVRKLCGRII